MAFRFGLSFRARPFVGDVSWRQLLAVLVFFTFAFVFTDVMSGVCMYRMPKGPGWPHTSNVTNPVLPDVGFDLIPYIDNGQLPTNFLLVLIGLTMLYALTGNQSATVMIARFFLVDAVLLCYRSFTIVATSMNNPDPRCNNCGSVCPSTVWGCIWLTLSKFPFFSCGDMMFSGHTVHFFLCALVFSTYYDAAYAKAVRFVVWVISVIGTATLIACRYHYSIDVLIAGGLTVLTWGYFHYAANERLKHGAKYVPENAVERFVDWVEQRVSSPLPSSSSSLSGLKQAAF